MGLIFIGRIAQAVLALLALRIMTSFLTPEEMGRWSLLLATSSFFVLATVNPLGMFINRRLHAWVEQGKINRYMTYYSIYLVLVALLAVFILYVSNPFYIAVPGMPLFWVGSLVACSIIFATLNQTYIPALNLLGYRGLFITLTLGTVALGLIVSVLLVSLWKPEAELWQAGQLAGQGGLAVIGGLLFFRLARAHKANQSDREGLLLSSAKMLSLYTFVWPLAISVLLTWIQSQSYRFLVQDVIGLQALGLFVVGYGVSASLIGVFESIVSTYFIPSFYKQTSSENRHEQALAWREYAGAMLVSLLISIAVIISVSGELAHVLLDIKFAQAAQYIIWGALAEAARVTVATYALAAHAAMDTKKLIVPNVIGAIAAPMFVFLLVSIWSAHGVGMGLVLAGFMAVVSSHFVLSRSFEIIMPWTKLLFAGITALALIVLAYVGHAVVGSSETMVASLLWLSGMGGILLLILFAYLKPYIYRVGG
ncbi:lipopolysaccharide biosynthesis protein [Mariprofundus ferrooxydans]|uniref:lipopolysaccharide biosynthesis protein n=1 Tax=Mariprofundus ferrooxydans TaxID=314344 RepID=UPI000364D3AF|nr:hypothetical protein [Mariprofundus ferrooxydans]